MAPHGTVLAASVVLGGATGLAVCEGWARHTERSTRYTSTTQFQVWALVIVAIWASLPLVWVTGGTIVGELGAGGQRNAPVAIATVLGVVVVGWLGSRGAYSEGGGSFYYLGLPRLVLTYAGAAIALVPTVLVFARIAADPVLPPPDTRDDPAALLALVQRLIAQRRAFTRALAVAGGVVSAGVLATGAQRQAFLAVHTDNATYPPVFVVVWGVAASALLIAIALPGYRRLVRAGEQIVETTFPLLAPGQDCWRERLGEREDLAGLLDLSRSGRGVFQSAVVVAGPLASAGISLLLPGAG